MGVETKRKIPSEGITGCTRTYYVLGVSGGPVLRVSGAPPPGRSVRGVVGAH